MAQSTWRQIGPVLELVEEVALAHRHDGLRVLDVGCGWGHYGVLIADQWPWATVTGMDARPQNVRWRDAYATVWPVVLPDPDSEPGAFDLVLLLDVIEHLPREDGLRALAWCRRHGPVILATPNGFMEQDGALYDEHLSGWTVADIEALGAQRVTVVPGHPAADSPGQIVCMFPQETPCPS